MTHLSTSDLISATAGKAVALGDRAITAGLTTDSRAIVPGCVFLALCGERFDGNIREYHPTSNTIDFHPHSMLGS